MTTAGLTALVIVPVTADSRRLGVLILGLGSADGELLSLSEPDARTGLAVAEVDLMGTIGRQAGQALELHVEDGLRLQFGEPEVGHEADTSLSW